jgi:dihydroflavonol-4-reductase
MSKILVTGATGFAGSHLTERLVGEGQDVRILVRPGADVDRPDLAGAEVVRGDVTDAASVRMAVAGVDIVYHIAALFRKARFPDSTYWATNYDGALNLIRASMDEGVRRFVHCSTVGVLGSIEKPPANENSPYNPGDVYQRSKCEAEQAVLRHHAEQGFPAVVVRPAGIYGPGDVRWLKLFKSIAKHRFPMIGSGKTLIHWVYISDLVDAFRLAADSPSAPGQVYIAAGERYVSLNQLAATIAGGLGVPAPKLHIPFKPVYAVSAVCEDVCRKFGIEPPIFRRRVEFFIKDRAFDIGKAKRELGYAPKVSLEDGVGRTIAWYREQGLL